jgi:hypothetical protein
VDGGLIHFDMGHGQGLALAHSSAQLEQFLTLKTPPKRLKTLSTSFTNTP